MSKTQIVVCVRHESDSESFNDWGGRGYDDSALGEVTKTAPPGIGLHDPLHGRQACPEFNSFHQGIGKITPPLEELFPRHSLSKRGQTCDIPAPPNC